MTMSKKKQKRNAGNAAPATDNLRLDPEQRLSPKFDSASIAKFPVAKPGKMGFRVVDNAAEEHIM